jgi:hypothetical protein
MSLLKWEQRGQEKHMVSITFLFTSEGHKAFWGTFLTRPDAKLHGQGLVLRPLSQFLGAFSQGQISNHTGKVWSWNHSLSSLELSHRPNAKSHRHSPTAGSDTGWNQRHHLCVYIEYLHKIQNRKLWNDAEKMSHKEMEKNLCLLSYYVLKIQLSFVYLCLTYCIWWEITSSFPFEL